MGLVSVSGNTENFLYYKYSLRKNVLTDLEIGANRFLSHSFKLVIHDHANVSHSTLHKATLTKLSKQAREQGRGTSESLGLLPRAVCHKHWSTTLATI